VEEADTEFEVISEPKVGLFGRLKEEARVRARVRPRYPRSKGGEARAEAGARRGGRGPRSSGWPRSSPRPALVTKRRMVPTNTRAGLRPTGQSLGLRRGPQRLAGGGVLRHLPDPVTNPNEEALTSAK